MKITLKQIKERMFNNQIFITDEGITEIEAFPKELTKINIAGNKLRKLPKLPSNLQELHCYDNELNELPKLPKTLMVLSCENNNFKDCSFDLRELRKPAFDIEELDEIFGFIDGNYGDEIENL